MEKRNLDDVCKECELNHTQYMTFVGCMNVCGVPYHILKAVEKERNKVGKND